jgi:hypothetical protein
VNLLYIVVQPKGVDSVARDSVVAPKYIFIKETKWQYWLWFMMRCATRLLISLI